MISAHWRSMAAHHVGTARLRSGSVGKGETRMQWIAPVVVVGSLCDDWHPHASADLHQH